MAIDNGRLKHLIVQQVIMHMANKSFLLKGWSTTLLSAIVAIAVKDSLYRMIWIAFLPVLMFWMLDGYFLRQERLYRKLWDNIRAEVQDNPTDFCMDTSEVASEIASWLRVSFSETLLVFHGTLFYHLGQCSTGRRLEFGFARAGRCACRK
jgi:hypothetical protein